MVKETRINLPEGRSYSILIEEGLLEKAGTLLADLNLGRDPFIVTDTTVERLYGNRLLESLRKGGFADPLMHAVEPGEQSKTTAVWASVLDALVDYSRSGRRRIFLVGFGGGVVGDLAGFVAAVYRRGIPIVQIATTVIAMVDSAIGGKTGVDHPRAKNLIGAFHQPGAVLIDPDVLSTLDERELRAGIAEVIKYGVIRDPEIFDLLRSRRSEVLDSRDSSTWADLVERCAAIKAWYVEQDEFDRTGIRAELNFGHTVGHAWEASLGYGDEIRHGEAVAAGMIAAVRIASRMGLAEDSLGDRIEEIIVDYGLPDRITGAETDDIIAAMRLDKKNISGSHRFVLPRRLGHAEIVDGIDESLIREVVDELTA